MRVYVRAHVHASTCSSLIFDFGVWRLGTGAGGVGEDHGQRASSELNLHTVSSALTLSLSHTHTGPRATRIFKAIDVSADGSIEYEEFLAVFKPALTTYPYDLEAAAEGVGAQADLIIVLVDPKTIHFHARELALISRLHSRFPNKLRLACYVPQASRGESKLRSHLLPATRQRLEQTMGLPANALLAHLPSLWVPPADGSSQHVQPVVDNQVSSVQSRSSFPCPSVSVPASKCVSVSAYP